MKKTILVLSALSVYLFACEKEEESEQSKMLNPHCRLRFITYCF